MPRPKAILPVVNVTLSLNTTLVKDVDRIVLSGLFGNSRAECVARLTAEGIRHLIREGVIPKRTKELTEPKGTIE